ncbi:MAG: hypothetical protein OEY28_14110, partial [Nitrospira sp.]|nr:hypothetical protein [Nitrospira sp.]
MTASAHDEPTSWSIEVKLTDEDSTSCPAAQSHAQIPVACVSALWAPWCSAWATLGAAIDPFTRTRHSVNAHTAQGDLSLTNIISIVYRNAAAFTDVC